MRESLFCTRVLLAAAVTAGLAPLATSQEDAPLAEQVGGVNQTLEASGRSSQPTIMNDPVIDEVTMGVSGTVGGDYNTHFVSYGFDIWGGGDGFGRNSTFNPFAELYLDFGEVLPDGFAPLVGTIGIWGDVNNNGPDTLGGDIQEVDFYYGLGTGFGDFAASVTYQQWIYAGGVEQVLDLGVSYDDSGLWGEDSGFALNPSVLLHKRLAASNVDGDTNGLAVLLGIEPSFELISSDAYPLSVSIPVVVGFGDDRFYGEGGFAYASVGAQFSVPLAFIPTDLGEWGLGAGITYYTTDEDAIGNVDDDFLTGNVGVSLSF